MANYSRGWIGGAILCALLVAAGNRAFAEPAPAKRCDLVNSGEWRAHVVGAPGASARLVVTGTVGVKPATVARLVLDPAVMESWPVQRSVIVETRTPREPTIDMLVRRDLRGEWPVTLPLGAIRVRCGGKFLARVEPTGAAR